MSKLALHSKKPNSFSAKPIAILLASLCLSPTAKAVTPVAPVLSLDPAKVSENYELLRSNHYSYPTLSNNQDTYWQYGIPGVFFSYVDTRITSTGFAAEPTLTFVDPMYKADNIRVELFCSKNADLSDPKLLDTGLSTSAYGLDWGSSNPYLHGPWIIKNLPYPDAGSGCTDSPIPPNGTLGGFRYQPTEYPVKARSVYYWTVISDLSGSGEKAVSNAVELKLLQRPMIFNKEGKILPKIEAEGHSLYPVYLSPGAGKVKVGSIGNPNAALGFTVRSASDQPPLGTVTIEGGDIYYAPNASFGVGDNKYAVDSFTVTAGVGYDLGGTIIDPDWSLFDTAKFQIHAYSETAQGDPVFRFVTNDYVVDNLKIPGYPYSYLYNSVYEHSRQSVFPFTPVKAEATQDVFHTPSQDPRVWDKAWINTNYVYLYQTDGAPCPIFPSNSIDSAKKFLSYQADIKRACIVEDVSTTFAGNAFKVTSSHEPLAIFDFLSTIQFQFLTQKSGTGTVAAKIQQIDKTGTVLKTSTLKYERKIDYPEYFDFTTKPNFVVIDGSYVVFDRQKDVAALEWPNGSPQHLKTSGSLKVGADAKTFAYKKVSMDLLDNRAVKDQVEPGNTLTFQAFTIAKEKLPATTSTRRANGTFIAYFGSTQADKVNGSYTVSLKRISALDGSLSDVALPDGSITYCTDWQASTNQPARPTYMKDGCPGEIVLPKALVNDIYMTEDRLVLQFDAVLDAADPVQVKISDLRKDDYYFEYFVRRTTLQGFEGNILPPSAVLNVPHPGLKGKPMAASLSKPKNIAKVVWTVTSQTDPGFEPIVTTRRNTTSIDLSALPVGTYTVQTDLYNEGDDLVRMNAASFAVYSMPTAVLRTPKTATVGKSYTLTADVAGLPEKATASWQVGYDSVPATISADRNKITATYVPAMRDPAAAVKLTIQLDPDDGLSTVNFDGDNMLIADMPKGTLETKAKVFWVGKPESITFNGDADAKRLDWIITRPDGQEVTKPMTGVSALTTQDFQQGTSSVKAKAYNAVGEYYLTEPIEVKLLQQPKVTFTLPNAAPANEQITLSARTSGIPAGAIVQWKVGNATIPATVGTDGVITTPYILPSYGSRYETALIIQVDPTNPYSTVTYSGSKIQGVAYGKVAVTITPPAVLDVGEAVTYKATVKPSWDLNVLPLQGAGLIGEWELPDGTRVPGLTLNYTPTLSDYTLYLAGKKPVFRAWVDGAQESTMTMVQTNVVMYEPWVMPPYSLIPKSGGASVVAPSTVVLRLTPGRAVTSTVAKYRGLKFEWSVPQSANANIKVQKDVVTAEIKGEGTYPIEVIASDRYGNESKASFTIEAVNAALSMTKLQFSPNPAIGRVPVDVGLKVATVSTHQKERITQYETFVDGTLAYTSKSVKPVRLTTPGDHEIAVRATSNYGNTASMNSTFTARPNTPPSCSLFKVSTGKSGSIPTVKATANCRDSDGKIKGYAWTINGNPTRQIGAAQSYAFENGEPSVTIGVTVIDDSGDSTTYEQTILKP